MSKIDILEKIEDPYPNSRRKIFCNTCQTITNHYRKFGPYLRKANIMEEPDEEHEWIYIYHVWSCAGCDDVSFEIMEAESWVVDPDYNNPYTHIEGDGNLIEEFKQQFEQIRDAGFLSTTYPFRTKGKIKVKNYNNLPKKLDEIYKESLNAYNQDLLLLCTVGLRSLLEGICIDRGAPKRKNLVEQIDFLKGDFPENLVNDLHEFRFMGNESVHDLESPSKETLRMAILVIETLLNYLYQLQSDVGTLKLNRYFSKGW